MILVSFLAVFIFCLLILKSEYLFGVQPIHLDNLESNADVIVERSPREIVIEYCNLSREGKYSDLRDLITLTPQSYINYLAQGIKLDRKNKHKTQSSSTYPIIIGGAKPVGTELAYHWVATGFPDQIKNLNSEVQEIVDEKIRDNDGRVRVKFRSNNDKSFIFETDFLIHKESEKWKIFMISEIFLDERFPE